MLFMAGKKTGPRATPMTQGHRDKIANSNILNRLINHALGQEEMTQTQVTAGLALMKKCLPDLQAITIDGNLGLQVTLGEGTKDL